MSGKLDVEDAVYASSSRDGNSKRYSSISERPPSVSRLSPTDHSIICQAIGALTDDENHKICHPRSYIYPPKGLPRGLYKDVIRSRTLAQYEYCRYCSPFRDFNTMLLSTHPILSYVVEMLAEQSLTHPPPDFTSLLFTCALILQLLLGAALTALGSTSAGTNGR